MCACFHEDIATFFIFTTNKPSVVLCPMADIHQLYLTSRTKNNLPFSNYHLQCQAGSKAAAAAAMISAVLSLIVLLDWIVKRYSLMNTELIVLFLIAHTSWTLFLMQFFLFLFIQFHLLDPNCQERTKSRTCFYKNLCAMHFLKTLSFILFSLI